MKIDINKAQKLINETIGSEYETHNIYDSEKYVFIDWKHKNYELDDERGHRIGVGPIAYNKNTKEYKLLGSGDMLSDEYRDHLFANIETDNKKEYQIPNKSQIEAGILRRKYVNTDDIFHLAENFKKEFGELRCHLSYSKEIDIDLVNQAMINLDVELAMKYFISFWNKIEFEYSKYSETELLVTRIKKTSV